MYEAVPFCRLGSVLFNTARGHCSVRVFPRTFFRILNEGCLTIMNIYYFPRARQETSPENLIPATPNSSRNVAEEIRPRD